VLSHRWLILLNKLEPDVLYLWPVAVVCAQAVSIRIDLDETGERAREWINR